MFLRFNQILFGGFLYAAQSALLISILGLLSSALVSLLIPGQSHEMNLGAIMSAILLVGGTVMAVAFMATFLSFTLFMLFRLIKKGGDERVEAWLVPIAAAMMVNGMILFNVNEKWRWEPAIFLLALSVGSVPLSRAVYQRVWAKLVILQADSGSSV